MVIYNEDTRPATLTCHLPSFLICGRWCKRQYGKVLSSCQTDRQICHLDPTWWTSTRHKDYKGLFPYQQMGWFFLLYQSGDLKGNIISGCFYRVPWLLVGHIFYYSPKAKRAGVVVCKKIWFLYFLLNCRSTHFSPWIFSWRSFLEPFQLLL